VHCTHRLLSELTRILCKRRIIVGRPPLKSRRTSTQSRCKISLRIGPQKSHEAKISHLCEVLGANRRQSQQSRLELGLRRKRGFRRARHLRWLTLTATMEKRFVVHADEKLTVFFELESVTRESGRIAELGPLRGIMISADSTALKRKKYDEHQKSW
jgi:hypothetical protein